MAAAPRGIFLLAAVLLASALLAVACTPDSELSDPQLYRRYCSECHGEDGSGNESLREAGEEVDLLVSRRIRERDREFVHRRIAYGYAQMPAYVYKLDPPDLERLVDFTMRLQEDDTHPPGGEHGPATPESDVSEAPDPG